MLTNLSFVRYADFERGYSIEIYLEVVKKNLRSKFKVPINNLERTSQKQAGCQFDRLAG